MTTERDEMIRNTPRLRPPRTPKQASIWPSVVVSATAIPMLTGCVTASGDAAAPLAPGFIAAAVGIVMVWVFMVKASAAVAAVLVEIRKALFELTAVVASFLFAAAVTGTGVALVIWVTLS